MLTTTRTIHLLPGDWKATNDGATLVTVLGSCVSACLWDPHARIAGMNHFMLPGESTRATIYEDAKFGVHSMELLITALQKLGAQRANLEAKVFGGGAVLECVSGAHIGERNAEFALEYLAREGIPVVSRDLCGPHARKIVYDTVANKVHVKHLRSSERVAPVEKALRETAKPTHGTVELF
jgi:chemotaxis protein CheD